MDDEVIRWWRRNRLALLALVVLIPAAVFTGIQLNPPLTATAQLSAEPRESLTFSGTEWGSIEMEELVDTDGLNAPADGRVMVLRLDVVPGENPPFCSRLTLAERSTGREWRDSFTSLGVPLGNGLANACDTTQTEPYSIAAPFVVAKDAQGPFMLTLTASTEAETVELRLLVDDEAGL